MPLFGDYSKRRKSENEVAGGMNRLKQGFGTLRGGRGNGGGCVLAMLPLLLVAALVHRRR
jgi:hypothetical protein